MFMSSPMVRPSNTAKLVRMTSGSASTASVQARSQLLVAVLGVTVAAAEARSSTEYFVVRQKPKTKTLRIVGDARCRTQAEAESGMKIIKASVSK
jgi:hypothetical protein